MKDGRIRVIVRSRKVPSKTFELAEPVYSTSGMLMGTRRGRLVTYDDVLDDAHKKAIEEGRRLSCSLGLDLEVVDRSKAGPFRRLLSLLSEDGSARINVVVSPSCEARAGALRMPTQPA